VSTRFNSTSALTATDPSPANGQIEGTNFGSLTYREVLETRGSGINARIGAIYRVNDAIRVGASVQTPTLHSLSETYTSSLNVIYDTPITIEGKTYSSGNAATDPGAFDYRLTSPFRASGGAAVVIGKYGFLSGDVEYVNYGQARLNNDNTNDAGASSNYDFSYDNDDVKDLYQSAVNLRLGGELRYDIFRFRAGFAHYGDPYKVSTRDRSQSYYTGGVGLRQKNFFLDLAGVYNTTKRYYNPYVMPNLEDTPEVTVDANRFTTTITAGFLF
jgi:long-subunit fatty acid transport protein